MGSNELFTVTLALIISVTAYRGSEPGFLKREHSLTKPYSTNGMSIPLWDFRDNVMITNNFIRLTQDHQGKRGGLWNRLPCLLRDWEVHIQFHVHGGGKSLAADGFAIWYTKQRMEPGPVFGSRDQFSGLGVFLDTYKNGPQAVSFPFITGMVNNGSDSYDHAGDGRKNSVGSCLASFRNKDYETAISVRYVQEVLTVSIDVDGNDEWKECFKVNGMILPTGYFLGVSAATGDLADNHDIMSIKMYEVEVPGRPAADDVGLATAIPGLKYIMTTDGSEDAHRNSSMSGWKLFLIAIVCILGFGVCGVVGFLVFQKHQEEKRKRFY